jgi:tetratricopeptide (TPR) repeat protein
MYGTYKKRIALDAYSYAVFAIACELANAKDDALNALKEAISNDSQNTGVKTAQAYLAMRSGKTTTLASFAQDLNDNEGQLPESMYYMGAYFSLKADYENVEKFYRGAVLSEPACFDVYVQLGIDAMRLANRMKANKAKGKTVDDKDINYQYEVAKVYFEIALKVKPDSAEALTGLAVLSGNLKKDAEMTKFAKAAASAGPAYAAGNYILSVALQAEGTAYRTQAMKFEREGAREDARKAYKLADDANEQSKVAMKKAQEADPVYIALIAQEPKLIDADAYFLKSGKLPFITAPGQ